MYRCEAPLRLGHLVDSIFALGFQFVCITLHCYDLYEQLKAIKIVLSKRVLLVQPPTSYLPVGIAHVVGALARLGIDYHFMNSEAEALSTLTERMRTGQYLCVASGGMFGSFPFFRKFFAAIKEIDPDMPCVLGGHITSDLRVDLLFNQIPLDYLVFGEAEETFPELLKIIDKRLDPADTPGIAYRDQDGAIHKNKIRQPLDLTSENVTPDWSFFDISGCGVEYMPVFTGRGCYGRCSFCSPGNRSYRSRPVEHVLAEVEYVNRTYNHFTRWLFLNEVFFPEKDAAQRFCEGYKALGINKPWYCLMRVDADPDILPMVQEAGCTVVNVGIESGSDSVLDAIRKDVKVNETRRFIRAVKKAGLIVQGSFMVGNYDETEEDMKKTVDLLIEEKVSGPHNLVINYPGTLNYSRAKKRGMIGDELNYLENICNVIGNGYTGMISNHLAGRINYLNLSAMDTPTLFRVASRELRRYYTKCGHMENVTASQQSPNSYLLQGTCPFCGEPRSEGITLGENLLHQISAFSCRKCWDTILYFSPFDIPEVADHYAKIRRRVSAARKLVLAGTEGELRLMLQYDLFGINYNSIEALLTTYGLPPGEHVLTYPVRSLDDCLALQPDMILAFERLSQEQFAHLAVSPLAYKVNFVSPPMAKAFNARMTFPWS